MKIDGYAQAQASELAAGSRPVGSDRKTTAEVAGVPGADQVTVSADAQILAAALKTAEAQPTIRTGLVEQMRARLAAGEIGNDPVQLADRLIDSLLEE